jgi:hypothetical protein
MPASADDEPDTGQGSDRCTTFRGTLAAGPTVRPARRRAPHQFSKASRRSASQPSQPGRVVRCHLQACARFSRRPLGARSRKGALEDIEDAHREFAGGVQVGPEVGDADPEQPR